MNILFLSTRSPYPLISGHSLRTYHILKGAAANHEVRLLTFVQLEDELKKTNVDHLRSFCTSVHQFRIPADTSKTKLGTALFLNLLSPLPFVAQKYNAPEMRKKIREIIKQKQIDIIHVDMLPLTTYINEFPNIPKILVNHNVESLRLYRWFQNEKNILKKIYLGIQYKKLRRYEINSMKHYDSCVVVSEADKSILEGLGVKSKIFVVPNGTDTEFFKPQGMEVNRYSVIWLGHMDVHTNRDAAIYFWRKIFPLVLKKLPQVRMTFVGTSPPAEIVEGAKVNDRVKTTGFVDDIRPHVEQAGVFVVPIRIGSGTRLKILDAMAMKKAIVSTSVGCEGLRVTNGENILIADTPEDFADRVVKVLTDDGMRRRLEENARKLAKEYDWKRQCAIQNQVYRQVVGQ